MGKSRSRSRKSDSNSTPEVLCQPQADEPHVLSEAEAAAPSRPENSQMRRKAARPEDRAAWRISEPPKASINLQTVPKPVYAFEHLAEDARQPDPALAEPAAAEPAKSFEAEVMEQADSVHAVVSAAEAFQPLAPSQLLPGDGSFADPTETFFDRLRARFSSLFDREEALLEPLRAEIAAEQKRADATITKAAA